MKRLMLKKVEEQYVHFIEFTEKEILKLGKKIIQGLLHYHAIVELPLQYIQDH